MEIEGSFKGTGIIAILKNKAYEIQELMQGSLFSPKCIGLVEEEGSKSS